MRLGEPPLCSRCSDSPDSVPKLEQHAAVMSIPSDGAEIPEATGPTTALVSLYHPWQDESNAGGQDPLKRPPATRAMPQWMSLLPSNRNAHVRPPRHSALHRRSSFPYFQSTRYSSPFSTPVGWPITEEVNGSAKAEPSGLVLIEEPPVQKLSSEKLSNKKPSTEQVARLPGAWLSSTSLSDTPHDFSHHGSTDAIVLATHPNPRDTVTLPPDTGSASVLSNSTLEPLANSPIQKSAFSRDITASPSPQTSNSTVSGASMKRQQSDGGTSRHRDERPSKLQKSLAPVVLPDEQRTTSEVLDTAPHKMPLFRELSGFFTSRKQKLVLPSRALESRQSITWRAGHQRIRSPSQPSVGEEVIGLEPFGSNSHITRVTSAHGGDGTLSRRTSRVMSNAVIDKGWGLPQCESCKTCPCHGPAATTGRQPILRRTMRQAKR